MKLSPQQRLRRRTLRMESAALSLIRHGEIAPDGNPDAKREYRRALLEKAREYADSVRSLAAM